MKQIADILEKILEKCDQDTKLHIAAVVLKAIAMNPDDYLKPAKSL